MKWEGEKIGLPRGNQVDRACVMSVQLQLVVPQQKCWPIYEFDILFKVMHSFIIKTPVGIFSGTLLEILLGDAISYRFARAN